MKKIKLVDKASFSLKPPFNFKKKDQNFAFFSEIKNEKTPVIYKYSLENVYVSSESVVFDKSKKIIYELYEYSLQDKYKKQNICGDLSLNKFPPPGGLLASFKKKIFLSAKTTVSRFKKFHGNYLLITDERANNNFYHWINEALLRYIALDKNLKTTKILLSTECYQNEYVKNSLKALSIDKKNILLIPKGKIFFVEKLTVVTPAMFSPGFNHYLLMIKLKNKLLNYYKNKLTLNLGNKIYMSREKSKNRKIINEAHVLNLLDKYGFKKINAEDFTLIELISIMYHTKYFISMVGAGLTHMMFMEKKGFVLELIHKKFISRTCSIWGNGYKMKFSGLHYYTMASTLDLNYCYQPCDRANKNSYLVADDIYVNLIELEENIKLMLSRN